MSLLTRFNVLDTLSPLRAGDSNFSPDTDTKAAAFDDLDDDEEARDTESDETLPSTREGKRPAAADNLFSLPEERLIVLPSNSEQCDAIHTQMELKLRIEQADKCLQALRDAIADKSFQYSHVIRAAPRKSVNTRARATIAKVDHQITYYARVYARCRQAMERLDADDVTLRKYQILSKEHVRSSTALLDPNKPGSTRVQLSWIWKTAQGDPHQTPDALRECE